MEALKKDIQGIRSDCFALQREFEEKITQLHSRIAAAEQIISAEKLFQQSLIQKEEIKEVKEPISENTITADDFVFTPPNKEVELPKNRIIQKQEIKKEEKVIVKRTIPTLEQKVQKKNVTKKVQKEPTPSILEPNPFSKLLIDIVFPPFRELTGYFTVTYKKYKEENKLPVFFLTLTGIVIMLFGFGFLAQYAVINYVSELNNWAKLGLGTILTSGVILWSTRLVSRSNRFREFGSSLIGLSIITNYLFIYFLSDTYLGFSALEGFCLIVANTGIALWLSFRFETRVVAVLSLIGGACVPFYMPLEVMGGSTELYFYFTFLFILTVSASYTAHKIKWELLKSVAFFTALGMIEYIVFFTDSFPNKGIYVIIFHAFAYLFFFIALWDGKQLKNSLDRSMIFMIAANVGLFVTNLFLLYRTDANFGLPINYKLLGIIYLVNVIPTLGVLGVYYQKLVKEIRLLLFVLMGTFVAVAIPSLLNAELMGIVWGVEACVLLYCGFRFNFEEVRTEAYLLLLLALGKIVYVTIFGSWAWSTQLFSEMGYWNIIAFGLLLTTVILIIKLACPKEVVLMSFETKLIQFLVEVEAVWTALVFFMTLGYFYEEWVFVLALPYFLAVIYLSNNRPFLLKFAEFWSVVGMFLCIVMAYAVSIDEITSLKIYNGSFSMYRFSEQILIGKVAMIEFLVLLWGLQFFYEKTHPTSIWTSISKLLRLLFYVLVPFLVLNAGYKISPNNVVGFSWVSVVIAFILYQFVDKNKVLLTTFYLWIFSASVSTIGFFTLTRNGFYYFDVESTIASISGFVVLLGLYLFRKGYLEGKKDIQTYLAVNAFLYHYVGIFIGLTSIFVFDWNVTIVLLIVSSYYLGLTILVLQDRITVLKSSLMIMHRVVLMILTSQFLILINVSLNVSEQVIWSILILINMLTLFYLTYKENIFYATRDTLWKIDMYWMQILLMFFYWSVSTAIMHNEDSILLTILLFIHAIALLFTSLKEYKVLKGAYISLFGLALLKLFIIDLAGVALVEKVIVFIVIGGILIGSSFLFLKFKKD